jgi:hypothetical protein
MGGTRDVIEETSRRPWLAYVAHLTVALWVFGGIVFGGRVLFFRDLSIYYYPNYVFLERSLAQGVWPLWNPTADGGASFLLTDPIDLTLVWLFGADAAMNLGPPIFLLIGMTGATVLARRLGAGAWGSWAAGAFYGLSGPLLSTVNFVELFHSASWAPWVLTAFHAFWIRPTLARIAALAGLGAVQIAALSPEVLLQTAVFGLALLPQRPSVRRVMGLGAALLLAALLAAPTLLGAHALVDDTARSMGFSHRVSFAWSARPILLIETALPHFFGDMHAMTDAGAWGQAQFPTGSPYLLSLYLGPALLTLAILAGSRGVRLYGLAALGVLLALGENGPLEAVMALWMISLRVPIKFFLMANLALCLLAGLGLDRALRREDRPRPWVLAPGLLVLLAGILVSFSPRLPLPLLDAIAPDLISNRTAEVIAQVWPREFLVAGALALAAGLALLRGRQLVPLAAVLVALDLAIVNESINTSAPATFYDLRSDIAAPVDAARSKGRYRWFSYGVAHSPSLSYSLDLFRQNSDVWLFYLDRQTLLPRAPTLDGLESAFGLDRVGLSPPGSTLTVAETTPNLFREHYHRLRLGNVRWVLSFHELPEDLVAVAASLPLPEVRESLRLYEIRDPLPRALWVPAYQVEGDDREARTRANNAAFDPRATVLLEREPGPGSPTTPGTSGDVVYEPVDPHTVRLRSTGDPGFLLVLDNFHRAWTAETEGEKVPVFRANGQYMAIPTPGGSHEVTLRFRPAWKPPAFTASALGLLLVCGLALAGRVRGR